MFEGESVVLTPYGRSVLLTRFQDSNNITWYYLVSDYYTFTVRE